MSKFDKLLQKIRDKRDVSFEEAESLLLKFGFRKTVKGSHHSFRKSGYIKTVTLTRKSQIKRYQLELIEEVLEYYDY